MTQVATKFQTITKEYLRKDKSSFLRNFIVSFHTLYYNKIQFERIKNYAY